jgi:outer membrane protein assembly factor BamB
VIERGGMIGKNRVGRRGGTAAIALAVIFCGSLGLKADDWEAYRGGKARRYYSSETFSTDLSLAWTVQSKSRPQPAWPAPARKSYWQQLESITARVTDDRAFHPIVVDSKVYFGSSADDHLYCLDASDGSLEWRFGTDGPIRYAPTVAGDRIVFGSDDGIVYCLNRSSGDELWRRRLSDRDWRIPGNGRLISSWPIRTGCVVVEDHVYATSGLYPQQGAWAFSIELASGRIAWKIPLAESPQGYLLASNQRLFVPTGRSQPISLDLETGKVGKRLQSLGGAFAVIDGDTIIGGRGNDGSLAMTDSGTGARLSSFKGSQLAVGPDFSLLFDGRDVMVLDRQRFHKSTRETKRWTDALVMLQQESKREGRSNEDRAQLRERRASAAKALRLAEVESESSKRVLLNNPGCSALLLTPTIALVGHAKGISAVDIKSGANVWSAPVSEAVVSLAFSDGRLVAGTPSGALHCFGAVEKPATVTGNLNGTFANSSLSTEVVPPGLSRVLAKVPVAKGFAVLAGARPAGLVEAILDRTKLKVVVLFPEKEEVAAFRQKALSRGLYGSRLAVHRVGQGTLPFTDDFAALVIHDGQSFSKDEVIRIGRPHGGVIWDITKEADLQLPGLDGEGTWTHLYGNPANTSSSGDSLVKGDLALQWFGGLGPRRMVDRHLRGSSPLYNSGILVVPGENVAMGVDAYTGEELWELDLPGSQRYSMPYDAGYMTLVDQTLAVAVKDECWMIRSTDGKVTRRIEMPNDTQGHSWGYVSARDDLLFGSIQSSVASRTQPSREAVDSDYRNAQPLVVGKSIFAMNLGDGDLLWQRSAGLILNPTITVGEQGVYFVECNRMEGGDYGDARLDLETFPQRLPRLVSLTKRSGKIRWMVDLPEGLKRSRNILYLAQAGKYLVAVGSYLNEKNDSTYEVACFDESDGQVLWQAAHDKGKPGETFHGEQIHHPVIIGGTLVAEPMLYDLVTGRPISPERSDERWRLSRPGHSCGTLSASDHCLFFRAGNPTVLALKDHLDGRATPQKLSPTRPGCWINIIPAGGLVLIPEASSGCVCDFSLQTSMAFRPL